MSIKNNIDKCNKPIPDDLFGKNIRLSFTSIYPLVKLVEGKEGRPSVGWFDALNSDYHKALIANAVISSEGFLIFKTRFRTQNGRDIYARMEWEQKGWKFTQFICLA